MMMSDKLLSVFERVYCLSMGQGRDLHQATEELGEIAKAYRLYLASSTPEEEAERLKDLKEEACDLAICCFSLFVESEPTPEDTELFWKTIDRKISKWKNS